MRGHVAAPVAARLSFVDRYLAEWILVAMAAGLGLGRLAPGLGDALAKVTVTGVSLPIALGLLVMMYPVLAKVRYDRLGTATGDRRLGERAKGRIWYETKLLPRIGPFALYGLLFTIVVLFALQGDAITSRPFDVVRIALPLLVYFALMWAGSMALGKAVGAEVGIDIASAAPRVLTAEAVQASDYVITMGCGASRPCWPESPRGRTGSPATPRGPTPRQRRGSSRCRAPWPASSAPCAGLFRRGSCPGRRPRRR
ncbi:hypothetical protein [Streptomyces sp. CB02613]|uniref:hypothetical protein n=1 Tax=Streptomyces sp. CB02613 TaxID=2020328 RepID=UPI001F24596A|nr:hypothetical protein [Streptomyces sp. CB02613]